MYLVDTNVWLELLLDHNKAEDARQFFKRVEADLLAITEFSLYSIGIILTRLQKGEVFDDFLSDTFEDSAVKHIHLDLEELKKILVVQRQFNLDFDDAYQYVAAMQYGYILISFDHDFDRTALGRKTPAQILTV